MVGTMTHPTDKVRLPVRSRSERATEKLNTAADWLAEIDQVLNDTGGNSVVDAPIEPIAPVVSQRDN